MKRGVLEYLTGAKYTVTPKTVSTGDYSNTQLWFLLMAFSAAAMPAVLKMRKRKTDK